MAEMTTLTAAIYRLYRTKAKSGTENTSPGITSRFEVFFDESMPAMKVCLCLISIYRLNEVEVLTLRWLKKEHLCMIDFMRRK